MILRSGLKYQDSDVSFNKNDLFRHMRINIGDICELDILFINDFCNIVSKMNNSNQSDKLHMIFKLYLLLYNNRDSIMNIYRINSDFIDFIILVYDKSITFTDSIMKLISDSNESPDIILQTLFFLYKVKSFIESEFNI